MRAQGPAGRRSTREKHLQEFSAPLTKRRVWIRNGRVRLRVHTRIEPNVRLVARRDLTCRDSWVSSSISPVTNTWRIYGSELRATWPESQPKQAITNFTGATETLWAQKTSHEFQSTYLQERVYVFVVI